ncbi:Spy/CpxP family protein refolding chaperone [Nitrospirillum viridazoti]|nr:Spy/CpxP family protein refolding chaperone [Nitrospirillum amazonense]
MQRFPHRVLRSALLAASMACAPAPWALAQGNAEDHTAHHPGQPPAVAAQPSPAKTGMAMPGGDTAGASMNGECRMMPGMMSGGMGGMAGMMTGDHMEGRLAFLKTELHITDAQGKVWSAFADAVRAAAKGARMMHGSMMGAATATWPERLAQHEKMLSAHLEALKSIRAAAEPLYAALDAEQKKTADDLMAGPMMGSM